MRFIHRLFFCLALSSSAWAQTVHWEPSSGSLSYNQVNELQLVFDDCDPKDDPAVPAIAGLEIQSVGQASSTTITNGHFSQSVVITYHARATQRGALTIPSFGVNTNKGRITVPPVTYQTGDATVGQGSLALDSVAHASFAAPKDVWAGQVFKLEYTLNVGSRYLSALGNDPPDWTPAPLSIEEWGKYEVLKTVTAGEQRTLISCKTRATTKQTGEIVLDPATKVVDLITGMQNLGFFARPNVEQFTITSSHSTVNVRPLPGGAPTSFFGAVGQFKLESKIVPTGGTVGEPITWTLTLSGTGNWPEIHGLPARDVSRDFRVVQPQARRTPKDASLFDATLTEDVVLIPTQPGSYTLGPITWSYFDPEKGAYQTTTTEKVVVTISAPPLQPTPAAPASSAPSANGSNDSTALSFSGRPVVSPGKPAAIPRDPLPGTELAPLPWDQRFFILLLLSPILLVALFWLGLACRRARVTDPNRPQREAALRLRRTLTELQTTKDPAGIHRLLQAWQQDTATLWRFAPVVPRSSDFASIATASAEQAKTWSELWTEMERVRYRPNETLSTDWVRRAETALDGKHLPSFSPLQLFHAKNLLPFAALLLITTTALPHLLAQSQSAESSYRSGEFTAAENSWRGQIEKEGNDWIARHNLSLALAQQNRWGEASAHAVAAFVQHPEDLAVRWNLAFEIDHAGFEPGLLTGFIADSPSHSVARQFSPAEWQRLMVCAAFVAAFGLSLILFRFYAPLGRWATYTGLSIAAVGTVVILLGSIAIDRYQESGDIRSALIWKPSVLRSIPTEADAAQKTSPLAPGTVGIVDKTFLTWSRIVFANGQTGWVRQEDLVRLWK